MACKPTSFGSSMHAVITPEGMLTEGILCARCFAIGMVSELAYLRDPDSGAIPNTWHDPGKDTPGGSGFRAYWDQKYPGLKLPDAIPHDLRG